MGTVEVFTAKKFYEFIKNSKENFLNKCKETNNRDYNTEEDINLAEAYFGIEWKLHRYGYYTYNHHTKTYVWSKKKPTNV